MTIQESRKIIDDNFNCAEDSFIYFLHEKWRFSDIAFWDYCNSITALSELEYWEKDLELTMKICTSYQLVLKYMIFHFDPKDLYSQEVFPENYMECIERLDHAVDAYFNGFTVDENVFK